MQVKDILIYLERLFPLNLASEFDQGKLGMQIGSLDAKVEKVIVALDASEKVIDEAIELNANLIIAHHPFLFNPLLSIDYQNPIGRKLVKVIKNKINIICMHTNIDVSLDGMNDYLASLLGLENISITTPSLDNTSFIRIGTIKKQSLKDLASFVSKVFNEEHLRVVGNLDKMITSVGIVGGSGGTMINEAKRAGCDCFITGEIKHNHALEAIEMDMTLIEIGHHIESLFMMNLVNDLKQAFAFIEVEPTKTNVNPFQTL